MAKQSPLEIYRVSETITQRLKQQNIRFHASDNISEHISEEERNQLVDELTIDFQRVLQTLIIDTDTDPNSHDTARRLAKMYVWELFDGRYSKRPNATSFPNVGKQKFTGMLVARADIKSMCSHHHQPVRGVCFIGIIPNEAVIGLSKYTRIAQWCARRGTLQEDLCNMIAKEIMDVTNTENVAVYIAAKHGCMENRGVEAVNSLTQTAVVHGLFQNSSVKEEFFSHVKMQQSGVEF